MSESIAAVATSLSSSSGINVIRISGDTAKDISDKIFSSKKIINGEMIPNMMYLGHIDGGTFSERAFCVYYKAPFSYTGEDVIEIHCHGGKGVTQCILRLICENGARVAEPGEFTKRAFLNGKMKLSEAEGVLDMINAETEGQVRNAYRLISGDLTKGIVEAETKLIDVSATLEAKLDYPEEMEDEDIAPCKDKLIFAKSEAEKLLKTSKRSKIIRNGIDIAIVGVPNAGKSSILNAILGDERAIVSDIAGTTRDVVKESVEIDGIKLNFLDTAGIRDDAGVIEKLGIERSQKAINEADIVIFVMDSSAEETKEERDIRKLLENKNVIKVSNKNDIQKYEKEGIKVSAKTKDGLEELIGEILKLAGKEEVYTEGVITSERHIGALKDTINALNEAIILFGVAPSEVVLANTREALNSLSKITGSNVTEDVINEVFSKFCVGK